MTRAQFLALLGLGGAAAAVKVQPQTQPSEAMPAAPAQPEWPWRDYPIAATTMTNATGEAVWFNVDGLEPGTHYTFRMIEHG